MIQEEIDAVQKTAVESIQNQQSLEALERTESDLFGRKGSFTALFKRISEVPVSQRASIGSALNSAKITLEAAIELKKKSFSGKEGSRSTDIDMTLPGIRPPRGSLHPMTSAIEEIEKIFTALEFVRRRYNEVEWDYYAFEALNMPEDHPARDEWETFFISEKPVGPLGRMLLTPHTSSGQVREMRAAVAEGRSVRMLNIAKTYRRQMDISHLPMFHQFEGLVVDTDITITQLIGTLEHFVKEFFSQDRTIRLRPFHFRFTEPSFEVDVSCGLCGGKGCGYCKQGWSEIGGAGMVHPNVLIAGGFDPAKYTGFAFGFGVERCYLMKNKLNIGDLRQLYSNDIRFLEQF